MAILIIVILLGLRCAVLLVVAFVFVGAMLANVGIPLLSVVMILSITDESDRQGILS